MSNRDDLLQSYEAGKLLETISGACALTDHNERRALASELVALHNEGLIDVVRAFESLHKSSNGPDFFLTRSILEDALPDLDAPVPSVMRCVLRLSREAGKDLASGTIIKSFCGFCEKAASRPLEALAEIEANPDDFADLLPGTLIAGSRIDAPFYYLAQAIRLCGRGQVLFFDL